MADKTSPFAAQVRQFLIAPGIRRADPRVLFWFSLSLLLAAYYGWLAIEQSFSLPYIVQDDARQHVFWMQRFVDADLLPGDWMADYFQSQAPAGYSAVYRFFAALGIHPFQFNKVLPALLGLLTTHYCFWLSLQILPIPAAAFASTVLLNQTLWMKDDLASGTPRAFVYGLLLAFLYYFSCRALLPCLVVLVLQPLFYPHAALLSGGVLALGLVDFKSWPPRRSKHREDYVFCGMGLLVVAAGLLPYVLADSPYGPLITPSVARTMAEFWPGGRAEFFNDNPLLFWFGDRPGLLPRPMFTPLLLAFSLFFPWLWLKADRYPPIMPTVRANTGVLLRLVIASLGLFFLAHLLLFQLHLPSRYTHHSFRILFALTASFAIFGLINHWLRGAEEAASRRQQWVRSLPALGATLLIAIVLVGYPWSLRKFPVTFNQEGLYPDLYAYLQSTPKDTLVAGLAKETRNLHVFGQRPLLVSPELGFPYHQGYYRQFRQHLGDLIQAQYSPDLDMVQTFIRRYGIDYWLLSEDAFDLEAFREETWLQPYQPETDQAMAVLQDDQDSPVLSTWGPQCRVLTAVPQSEAPSSRALENAKTLWLLDAKCLLTLPPLQPAA